MPVLHLDPEKFKREYGAMCHRHFPQQTLPTPYGASYCVIGPGESATLHQHYDGEALFVVKGEGEVSIVGEPPARARAGEIIYFTPHAEHELRNVSATEELAVYSVWWDDGTAASHAVPNRSLVIVAAPTPNGKLHLGHLSGPYVASNVYTRYLKARQAPVHVASGSDDNQSYTQTKAMQLGMTAEEVTIKFGDANEATLGKMGVDVDYFLRPCRTEGFPAFVQAFWQQLLDKGMIVRQEDAPSLWCKPCNLYLYEAHVKGGCPHCGEPTSGNGCEACARPNACVDLVNPRCGHCQTPATVEQHEQFFFPLEPHREALTRFFDTVAMPPRLRALADMHLADPLPSVAVSHYSPWGIPVPGKPGQVIFEFLEMAAGFLFQADKVAPAGQQGWDWAFKDAGTEVVQFLGIDNTFYFMVLMPGFLTGYDATLKLPTAFGCNEFFQLEGQKFSTSRNHAIWGDDALAHVSADALRFALAMDRPETEQTSFSLPRLEQLIKDDLIGGLEAWLAELDGRLAAVQHQAPAMGPLTRHETDLQGRLRAHAQACAEAYDVRDFSMRRAARTLVAFVADARDFGKAHQYLRGDRRATALAVELAALRLYAVIAGPLLPETGRRILAALGKADAMHWTAELLPLEPGVRVAPLQVTNFGADLAGARALAKERVAVG